MRPIAILLPLLSASCLDEGVTAEDLDTLRDEMSAEVDALAVQVVDLQDRVATLETENATLKAQIAALPTDDIESLVSSVDELEADRAADEAALSDLGTRVAGIEDAVDNLDATYATDADLATLQATVSGLDATYATDTDLAALQTTVSGLDATYATDTDLAALQTTVSGLDATYATDTALHDVMDALSYEMANFALESDLDPILEQIDEIQAALPSVEWVEATDAWLRSLEEYTVLLTDIAMDHENTLLAMRPFFALVRIDEADDERIVVDGDLQVAGEGDFSGNLTTEQMLAGDNFFVTTCTGTTYDCTPTDCLDQCISQGARMATADDLLAWVSSGQDWCYGLWYLDSSDPSHVYRGVPLYHDAATTGCGTSGTGDVPRIDGATAESWTTTTKQSCGCASIY